MKYNPKRFERKLTKYIAAQARLLEELINEAVARSVWAASRVKPEEGQDFSFDDYPALSRQVDEILGNLSRKMSSVVEAGEQYGWSLANEKNDDMLAQIIKSIGIAKIPAGAIEKWSQKNLPALEAFQRRKISGMSLSDKVWAYARGIKGDLELALDLGLAEGKSADRLAGEIKKYLNEPNRLYRRVRDEKGILHWSNNAKKYHPGQGVYRSSYKNARRLAATETNIAYRTSDNDRIQEMDFILGIEIHLSNNHTCLGADGKPHAFVDICDDLKGIYPKTFVFTGWHPLCRCYATTILPSKDEFMKYLDEMDEDGNSSYELDGEVKDVPQQFKDWCVENQNRIEASKEKGTIPYFIRDNYDFVSEAIQDGGPYYATITGQDYSYMKRAGYLSDDQIEILKSVQSPEGVQTLLNGMIDKSPSSKVLEYAKTYEGRSEDVRNLLYDIDTLAGRDEAARLRKIQQLKGVCGKICASDLESWGCVDGLTFKCVERGYTASSKCSYIINGKEIYIPEVKYDLVVFQSKSRKEYAYQIGLTRDDIIFNAKKASGMVDKLPSSLKTPIKRITFINGEDPYNPYWEEYYKMPNFRSRATDGKNITFWAPIKNAQTEVAGIITHESAHIFDTRRKLSDSTEYINAVKNDISLFKLGKIPSAFPSDYAKNVFYGNGIAVEDFADAMKVYVDLYRKGGATAFAKLYPNRAIFIEAMLKKWPRG